MKRLATILVLSLFLLNFSLAQVNVVQNGGFENWTNGLPDNWILKTNAITADPESTLVHGGNYSMKVTFTSTSTQKIKQTINNITGNTLYTFNIWVLDNDPGAKFRIWGYWNLSDGSYVTLNPGNLYSSDNPDWQLYTYQESAPANAISLDFELRFYDESSNWTGQGIIYIDDVEILGPAINAPTIENMTYEPFAANQPIDISCDVTVSSGTVDSVKLYYYTNLDTLTLDSLLMTDTGSGHYSASLNGYPNATSLIYWVKAWGNGTATISAIKRVLVGIPDIGMFHTQLDNDGLPLHVDHLARLRGIVTVASGIFSTSRYDFYMQDATGGINLFNFTMGAEQYNEGDSLEVVGTIDTYNGKVEITDFTATVLSTGNPVPAPIDVNIEDMGEEFEGRLIQIDNVTLAPGSNPWYTTPADTSFNVTITDGTGELTLRVIGSTDIGGNPEPVWPVTVIGIGSQYDYSAPYFEGYQILPRYYSDLQSTDLQDETSPVVYRYELEQNYPNPFNPETVIRYQLARAGNVTFTVYNLLGQKVYSFSRYQSAGEHSITFNGKHLPSGIYFYQLKSGSFSATRKMILTR